MSTPANPPRAEDAVARYQPANGGDKVTLAVLRSEVVHGFTHMDYRLTEIEASQKGQGERLTHLEKCYAVLDATVLKLSAVKLSAILGAVLTIILGLATVITKVAGLW